MQTPIATNEEFHFKSGLIISSTDLEGIITYSNRKFCEISGYSKDELEGQNHNIVRHPDMPAEAYAYLWKRLKSGKSWSGTIKNLRKDGKFYWVYSHISPIFEDGNTVGYSAIRRPASEIEIDETTLTFQNQRSE